MEQSELLRRCRDYVFGQVVSTPGCFGRGELVGMARVYGIKNFEVDPGLDEARGLVCGLVSESWVEFRVNPDDVVRNAFFCHDRVQKAYAVDGWENRVNS